MPELPEVEVLMRHLRPALLNRTIRSVRVFRPRVIRPTTPRQLQTELRNARIVDLARRGKYLLFQLKKPGQGPICTLLGHLGMTGRMYLQPSRAPLPKHTAAAMDLGRHVFVFEDTRYFGRLTLDLGPIEHLGPEPLSQEFSAESFREALRRSSQPIKIKLLDQRVVSGIGNIYASEALFHARIHPRTAARRLKSDEVARLWRAIRAVLTRAIRFGSTVPLHHAPGPAHDGLFYFGRAETAPKTEAERLLVYDRAQHPCPDCGTLIARITQAARSTYFCPQCQKSGAAR